MSPEAQPDISYSERLPTGAAASLVSEFWRFETGALGGVREHVIPPDGLFSIWAIFFNGAPQPMIGVTAPGREAHVTQIHSQMQIIGVRLQPAVFPALLETSATALAGQNGPLQIFGLTPPTGFIEATTLVRERDDWSALEALFAEMATTALKIDIVVQRITRVLIEINGDAAIGELARKHGISARQLQRRFRDAIGMSPKEFANIRRVRKLCIDALRSELGWSNLSLEAGFADQAHMARNIQTVFGLRPGDVRKRIREIAHGDVYS